MPRARRHDRHISQRPDSRRATSSVRPGGTASRRRGLAESIRSFGFEMGRLEDRHAAAARSREHRLRRGVAAALCRGARRRVAGPFSFDDDRPLRIADQLLAAAYERACPRSGAGEYRSESRSTTVRSAASVRATVRLSKTRSCGFPIASGTRSISSRRASTSTRFT